MIETPKGTKALVIPLTEDLIKLKDDHESTFLYFDEVLLYAIHVAQDEDQLTIIESELVTEIEKKLYERDSDDDYVAQGAVDIATAVIERIRFLASFVDRLLRSVFNESWLTEVVENVFFVADNLVVVCQAP